MIAESILRAVNNPKPHMNFIKSATHERYESNWGNMDHTFYLIQKEGIKSWNPAFASLSKNHILLPKDKDPRTIGVSFDGVISQQKFGQYQALQPLAQHLNLPLISIEHTLPVPNWNKQRLAQLKGMRGSKNVFISDFSVKEWGWDTQDPSVIVIPHGVDASIFKDNSAKHNDGKITNVTNDYKNRNWCCGWDLYQNITKDLPTNPVGDTKGFSKPAKDIDHLVSIYQNASVFVNTSLISPIPTSLIEAMFCGCPIVSTATSAIPSYFKNEEHMWMSNNEHFLRERLIWCLENREEALKMAERGKQRAMEIFSLDKHLANFEELFLEVQGKGYYE